MSPQPKTETPEAEAPTVLHVHHHDIEAHAASFNEGYDEAVRQFTSESADEVRLTACQWEDLRTVLDNFGRHRITSDMVIACERLNDALFPAIEPEPNSTSEVI